MIYSCLYSYDLWVCVQHDLITYKFRLVADAIEWPDDEDSEIPGEAQDLITELLKQNPLERLGSLGASQVKEHMFFDGLDWDSLLRQKAEFVPELEHEEDTSYFDSESTVYKYKEYSK